MPRPVSPRSVSADQTACEDLKAFERRLTEVVTCLRPQTKVWRYVLGLNAVCAIIGALQWLLDPVTFQLPFTSSLYNHLFFTISFFLFIILLLFGIHKRVVGPQIIVSRVRSVLSDFNMSCDENGRLILNPRPVSPNGGSKEKTHSNGSRTPTRSSPSDLFANKWYS